MNRTSPANNVVLRMKRLRRIEIAAWALGAALLITYGVLRAWSAQARDDAVAAFEQMRTEVAAGQHATSHTNASAPPQPDTSLWSQSRLAAYRESTGQQDVPEAILRVPSIKLMVPVFDGTGEVNLNRGAGRIEGTARIGENGNVGVASHRDGFFRVLKDVQVGDALYIDTPSDTLTYRVVGTQIVDPSNVGVLADGQAPMVTLVTCYPFYFVGNAPKRFIVHALRVAPSLTSSLPKQVF
jgi:sortase A